MTRYYHIATQLKEAFTKFKLKHIVIENNKIVDLQSKLVGRKKKGQYTTIIQETILEPSLNKVVVSVTLINQEWMTEIQDFLEKGSLPKNPTATRKLNRNVSYYVIQEEGLYRRCFTTLLLKCLTRYQANYVMNEMHKGICRMHSGSRSITTQVLRVKYYQSVV